MASPATNPNSTQRSAGTSIPAFLNSEAGSAAAEGAELDSFIVDRCTIHMKRKRVTPIAVDGEIKYARTPLELRLAANALKVVAAKCL